MNPSQSLDEHRVCYYGVVARCALAVSSGVKLRRVIDEADYVCNPCLAPLVPELSAMPRQFTRDELTAIASFAEEPDDTTRRLLAKYVARRYVQADILAWLANGHGAGQAVFSSGKLSQHTPQKHYGFQQGFTWLVAWSRIVTFFQHKAAP